MWDKNYKPRERPEEETWNLCDYMAVDILADLKAFKAMERSGCPADVESEEEYEQILDDIIAGFEELAGPDNFDKESTAKKTKALKLFAKWFESFWD